MTELTGLVVIGYFCWWSVNGATLTRDQLKALLKKFGIKYKMPKVNLRSTFLKAVREVRGAHKNKGILLRKIKKSADVYLFGLVDETVEKKQLDYSHSATMKFNPKNGNLSVDHPHKAFDLVKERYEMYKNNLNADDIRDIILTILSEVNSVSVRQRGGIYFVHETHRKMVEKLENLLPEIPGDNVFLVAPQIDTERSKKAIYKGFVESLKARIRGFETDLDDEKGISQKHALRQRLKEFKKIKKEMEFYKDALQFQVEDLDTSLESLTEKVKEKLLEKEE
jgi:hypothetical protein